MLIGYMFFDVRAGKRLAAMNTDYLAVLVYYHPINLPFPFMVLAIGAKYTHSHLTPNCYTLGEPFHLQ